MTAPLNPDPTNSARSPGLSARARRRVATMLRHLVLLGILVPAAYPLVWMNLAAFRPEADVQARPFGVPVHLTGDNLRRVLNSGYFGKAYRNSLAVSLAGVAIAVSASAAAAFAFARMRFRGKDLLFLAFLAGMMIPAHVTLIPLNRLMGPRMLHLKGTLWAVIGPYAGFALPISILILRRAFETIPRDLEDAARIDGCGSVGVFLHVAIPLARPALATVVIFNFLTMWNEFAFALTLLDPENPTLPLAVTRFKGEHDIELALTCAALAVVVLPLLGVYAVAQRHIIRGLTAGAVKG